MLLKLHTEIMKNILKILTATLLMCISTAACAQDVSALFEELDPSVVTIEVTEYKIKDRQITSSGGLGSGVIISSDGLIMTASHVVEFANEVRVKLQNGTSFQADVLSSSSVADVALLKLRTIPPNLKAVKMGESKTAKIGERVMIIGAPLGLEHSLSVVEK